MRRGRRPPEDGEYLERLNLRVKPKDMVRLRRRAQLMRVTLSEAARVMLVRGLDAPEVKGGED